MQAPSEHRIRGYRGYRWSLSDNVCHNGADWNYRETGSPEWWHVCKWCYGLPVQVPRRNNWSYKGYEDCLWRRRIPRGFKLRNREIYCSWRSVPYEMAFYKMDLDENHIGNVTPGEMECLRYSNRIKEKPKSLFWEVLRLFLYESYSIPTSHPWRFCLFRIPSLSGSVRWSWRQAAPARSRHLYFVRLYGIVEPRLESVPKNIWNSGQICFDSSIWTQFLFHSLFSPRFSNHFSNQQLTKMVRLGRMWVEYFQEAIKWFFRKAKPWN